MVESKISYKVDLDTVTRLMLNVPVFKEVKVAIDPDSCVETPLKHAFVCFMCSLVVWQPKSCSDCDVLSCEGCVEEWLLKSTDKNCGCCRQKYTSARLHRFIKEELDELAFSCELCQTQYKYVNA